MEENKSNSEIATEVAKEGAKMAGKAIKGTAKVAGKVAKTGAVVGGKVVGAHILIPILIGIAAVAAIGAVVGAVTGFFTRQPLAIEKTANVVEEVKKIGEFTTACYYEEMALQDSYTDTTEFLGQNVDKLAGKAMKKVGLGFMQNTADKASEALTTSKNEIVLIGHGRVRAGFNLSKINENDLNAHGDTLELSLPKTEVFEIIMNPSDFETEYEKGTWSHELLKPLKERAKTDLEQNAIKYGILTKAEKNGLTRLEALFKTFGFNTVILTVKKES